MLRLVSILLLAATVAACDDDPSSPPATDESLTRDLAALTRVTTPFHQIEAAGGAGWSARITGCMSHPGAGGMGFHYGNPEIIDGAVAVEEPELLVYEPQPDGSMQLVAVEYIVPIDAWSSKQPPRLFGRDFKVNEEFQVWALHVWLWKHNPAGLFADWNPLASCDAAV
ncbi:MAG TPA: hypothetical protein VGE02_00800 [Gemmatimonadales bacterium]